MQPNFLIVGAKKAGTTSLHHYLSQHPDVCMSQPKEPRFFSRDAMFARGLDFYLSEYYRHYNGEKAVGEADPDNLYLAFVPKRIRELLPEAKIIVALRNPVERAYSHWWMEYSYGLETLPFAEAIAENERCILAGRDPNQMPSSERYSEVLRNRREGFLSFRSYLDEGYYASQLRRYLSSFDRKQLAVVFSDELASNPAAEVRTLWSFLGVDSAAALADDASQNVAFNSAHLARWVHGVTRLVGATGIPRLLPARWRSEWWPRLVQPLSSWGRRPTLEPAMRSWLCQHYREHNRALEALLETDLSRWDLMPAERAAS